MTSFFNNICSDTICELCRLRRSNIRRFWMQICSDIKTEKFECPKGKPWIDRLDLPKRPRVAGQCQLAVSDCCVKRFYCSADGLDCEDPYKTDCPKIPAAACAAETLNRTEVQDENQIF